MGAIMAKREIPRTLSKIGQTTEVVMEQIRAREQELAELAKQKGEAPEPPIETSSKVKEETLVEYKRKRAPKLLEQDFVVYWTLSDSVSDLVSLLEQNGYNWDHSKCVRKAKQLRKGWKSVKTGEWKLPPLNLKKQPDEKKPKKDYRSPKQRDFDRLKEILSSSDPKNIQQIMEEFKAGGAPWRNRFKKKGLNQAKKAEQQTLFGNEVE
tara:strand:- start:1793 stop:2419 length:627 start_codon:yes stop_codon:yes gene_type:complete